MSASACLCQDSLYGGFLKARVQMSKVKLKQYAKSNRLNLADLGREDASTKPGRKVIAYFFSTSVTTVSTSQYYITLESFTSLH